MGYLKDELQNLYYDSYVAGYNHSGMDESEYDTRSYYAGYYQKELYKDTAMPIADKDFFSMKLSDYPVTPFLGIPDPPNRWIPCNNKLVPLYKWSGGARLKEDAESYLGCEVLAENLKGCKFIVLDIDGDHNEYDLDLCSIEWGLYYKDKTCTWSKPKICMSYDPDLWNKEIGYAPSSFHLVFKTDRIIPSMHFADCHIDVLGNQNNQLRFIKNKICNNLEPMELTNSIWEDLKGHVKTRRLFAS